MQWEAVDLPAPKRGEVLLRHTAVALNFIDIYHRSGLYPVGMLPSGLGVEAVGVVEAVGPGVRDFKVGHRVGYMGGERSGKYSLGAYAEARIQSAEYLFRLPAWLDDQTAAAVVSKGRTVEYLFNRTHKLKQGETIVFHSVAGGVGVIACQWARAVGATVIGTVGTEEKAKLARRFGCHHVVVTGKQDLVKEVMRITRNKGVDVVYDSVGKDLWDSSLECVRRLGLVVSFGSASGIPRPFDLGKDGIKKSIFVTRATSANYMSSPEIKAASTRALLRMMRQAPIRPWIGQTYPLKEVARAHRDAEARRTMGSTLLLP